MELGLIITVVLTVLTLAVWLFSFLMGTFKDGTAKAFWKFTWAGLAALATFGIAMLLRGVFADVERMLMQNALAEGEVTISWMTEMSDVVAELSGAIATPILFCILYLPVRWLFLIPQKLLWKHLVSPNLDKLIKDETGSLKFKGVWGVLWNIGGGVFRTCATIVLTSAIFLGLAGYTTVFADAFRPFVPHVKADVSENSSMVIDGAYAFSDNFAVRTAAFTYGGLFRTMTSVDIGEIDTSIPEVAKTTSEAGYKLYAIVLAAEGEAFTPDQISSLDDIFTELCETDFFPSLVAYGMNTAAEIDDVKEALLSSENDSLRDMAKTLIQLMKDATTESVRADLLSVSDLLREASSSGLLDYVLSDEENKEFPIKNLMDEERLTRLLMVVYDNSFGRALFTPIIDMALGEGLKALGSEPISLNASIDHMSRTEMEAEARRLAKIIANLGAVLDSMQGENVSLGSVNAGALGEAIDLIKDSELLGGQFEQVLDAIGKSETVKEALGDTSDVIIGSLKDAPSVEDTLVITQSFTVIAEELSKVTEGGDATANKEAVAGALQGLVNSSSEEGNDFILGKVDELFPAGEGEEAGAAMEGVKEIATSILEAVTDIEELTDEQAAVEADALLGLYDMATGNTEVSDNKEAAEEIIDNIASSTVLMKTVENAVENGNDFGVTENLPAETVDKIAEVIEDAEITEEQKATLLAFFGK